MRSIGKVNIRKLKAIVNEEYLKALTPYNTIESAALVKDNIKARIPPDWYDLWESAWSEIDRLINDIFNDIYYKK